MIFLVHAMQYSYEARYDTIKIHNLRYGRDTRADIVVHQCRPVYRGLS